ncbi:MAG TPA: histidinol-phosphate transaminase [bacterium]|nr:histidinol-phosphate transaminase [bacterium]
MDSKQLPPSRRSHQWLANPAVLPVRPYQPGKSVADIQREFGVREVVKLASNENAAGPSPQALRAIEAVLRDIHCYPDDGGAELKDALAAKYGLKRENVLLGHGATDILDIIARVFLCPNDEVISAQPSFPWFQILGQLYGAKNVVVPLRDHKHDLEAMLRAVTPMTKLMFVANPNNPTGTLHASAEIDAFLEEVPEHVVVVLDEAYIEYAPPAENDPGHRISQKPVITVRTFSKISGIAGLRIGYAVSEREIVDLLEKARQPFNTTALAHAGALASLKDREHVERSRWIVLQGKAFLYEEFSKMGLDFVPTEANFIFVDFHRNAQDVFSGLEARGFIIRPVGPTCARITIGSPSQNAGLVSALKLALARPVWRETAAEMVRTL